MKSSEVIRAVVLEGENSVYGFPFCISGRAAHYVNEVVPQSGDWADKDHCLTSLCLAAAIAEYEGD